MSRDTGVQILHKANRALAILEEQAAGYGSLEIPVSLRIQLEDKRREVAELKENLAHMINNDLSGWRTDLYSYMTDLQKHYGTVQIFGQPKPVPLEGIFTHIRFLDKPSAFRRYDLHKLQAAASGNSREVYDMILRGPDLEYDRAVSGLELVEDAQNNRRLMILGKPGAGKTTFLKYLSLQASQGNLDKIPVLLTLREWDQVGDYSALIAFIVQQFATSGLIDPVSVVEYLLGNTDFALLLFDGLDEIPCEDNHRDKAIAAIHNFIQRYPDTQIIITSRVAAVDYTFEGFKYLEIADFNDHQMHTFIQKWFRDDVVTADQFWQEFNLPVNRGLYELGQTPLLLTMLCLAYAEILSFPQRRADLYTEALDALLKKWDSSRKIRRDSIYKQLSPVRKQQMFARLGAQSFEAGEYVFPKEKMAERISAYLQNLPSTDESPPPGEAILRAIEAQHGIFVERAHNLYTFAHLTFQEYYTARYIVDNARYGTLKHLLHNHVTDIRWREVILLTASLLDQAQDFFIGFLTVLENLTNDDPVLKEFLRWSVRKAFNVGLPYRTAAIRAYYIWLVLDSTNTLISNTALSIARNLERALDVALDYELVLDRGLIYDYIRIVNLAREQTTDKGYGLIRVIENARGQELVNTFERSRKFNITIAQELNLEDLSLALSSLKIPSVRATGNEWQSFIDQIKDIITKYREIVCDWNFTNEQIQYLNRYLYVAQLLVECLDLADVSNREAILDCLFRPPNKHSEFA